MCREKAKRDEWQGMSRRKGKIERDTSKTQTTEGDEGKGIRRRKRSMAKDAGKKIKTQRKRES